jgi:8-oxo-dGTP pyrophosphatase MutT (NUDIX family)
VGRVKLVSMINIESGLADLLPVKVQTRYPAPQPGKISSAVLVPLLKEEAGWKLLFTRRSEQVADHRAQVSFPGGHVEPRDSGPLQTALREASEEIGIRPEDVRPLGILKPVDTRTNFRIWPVVGILRWPVPLTLSVEEVREVFPVPIDWLMEPTRLNWRPVDPLAGRTESRALFFDSFQGQVIWGATAMITFRLIEILRGGKTG